jgi:hypothetical protein
MRHLFTVTTKDPIVKGMTPGPYPDVSQQYLVCAVLQGLFPDALVSSSVNLPDEMGNGGQHS